MGKNPILDTGTAALDIRVNTNTFIDDVFEFTDKNNKPIDFTGFQDFSISLLPSAGVTPAIITFSVSAGTAKFLTPLKYGRVQLNVSTTVNNTIPVGTYVYDGYLTDSLGNTKKCLGGSYQFVDRGAL